MMDSRAATANVARRGALVFGNLKRDEAWARTGNAAVVDFGGPFSVGRAGRQRSRKIFVFSCDFDPTGGHWGRRVRGQNGQGARRVNTTLHVGGTGKKGRCHTDKPRGGEETLPLPVAQGVNHEKKGVRNRFQADRRRNNGS
jgi:hypothetical protein